MAGRIEASFRRRLEALPADAQRLMLVAAAEPAGEPALVWRAAERLGVGAGALAPAADAGLLAIGDRVTFRHPLVRSAVYRAASPAERRAVHQALAEATDPRADPDRRAWHRAQAVLEPDEEIAAELEASAGRARARGAGRRRGVPGAVGRADAGSGPTGGADAVRGAGQVPGRRVRCGAEADVRRGGRAAG
jgi:hypothetical protein